VRRKEEILEAVVKDYGMSKNEAELFEFYPVLTEIENTLANFQCWSQEKVDLASDDFGNSSRFFYSNKFIFFLRGKQFLLTKIFRFKWERVRKRSGRHPKRSRFGQRSHHLPPAIRSRPDPRFPKARFQHNLHAPNFLNCRRQLHSDQAKNPIRVRNPNTSRADHRGHTGPEASSDGPGGHGVRRVVGRNRRGHGLHQEERSDRPGVLALRAEEHPVKLHSAGWNVGIVSRSADIEQAAEMLVHNKFYKAGQNMDNLDVIYIHESIYKPFLIEAKNALYKFYTSAGDQNLNYGKITSSGNFNRLLRYLDKNDHNGQLETSVYHNERTNRINPIMIKNPDFDSRIMQDKIFGPILPLQTYSQLPELADLIDEHDHVENLFYFSENNYVKNDIKEMFNYQNLFFNCTNMPFDSVEFTPEYGKDATMNTALHGKYGFSSFSQQKLVYTARDPKSIAKKNFLKCKGIFLIDFF
jgi:hypothetical protein